MNLIMSSSEPSQENVFDNVLTQFEAISYSFPPELELTSSSLIESSTPTADKQATKSSIEIYKGNLCFSSYCNTAIFKDYDNTILVNRIMNSKSESDDEPTVTSKTYRITRAVNYSSTLISTPKANLKSKNITTPKAAQRVASKITPKVVNKIAKVAHKVTQKVALKVAQRVASKGAPKAALKVASKEKILAPKVISKAKKVSKINRKRSSSFSDFKQQADSMPLGAGAKAVMKMVEYLPKGQNYKIFFDNWFSSVDLAYGLLKLGIHSTATIQIRRVKGSFFFFNIFSSFLIVFCIGFVCIYKRCFIREKLKSIQEVRARLFRRNIQ